MKIGFDLISDLNLNPGDDFDWENKNLWINNPMAVKYWMNNGNSIHKYNKLYKDHLRELDETNLDNIKTY